MPVLETDLERREAGIEQSEARVKQMEARVRSARADAKAVQATQVQAEANSRSAGATLRFREKQYKRMKDLFATKSWMYKKKYRFALNASVSNLLDETDLITGGYEQLRFEAGNPDKFPPKYGYMFGRTFFVMMTFSF